MRLLFVGSIVGLGVAVLATWLLRDLQSQLPSKRKAATPDVTEQSSPVDAAVGSGVAPADSPPIEHDATAPNMIAMGRSGDDAHLPPQATAVTDTTASTRIVTVGEGADRVSIIRSQAQIDREAEDKDVDWAFHMEQRLQQLVAQRPSAPQFDVTRIECRQTFCELQAFAYDEIALPAWQRLMDEIKEQPWSQFGIAGTTSGNVNGRLVVRMTLFRRATGDS